MAFVYIYFVNLDIYLAWTRISYLPSQHITKRDEQLTPEVIVLDGRADNTIIYFKTTGTLCLSTKNQSIEDII